MAGFRPCWRTRSPARSVGRLYRGSRWIRGRVVPVVNNQTPFLMVAVLSLAPGILVTVAGLILLARNGTYLGPGSVRWWNWLTWRM